MKHLKLLFIIITILLIAGCKKYDDGPSFSFLSAKSRIVNTWKVEKAFIGGLDVTATLTAYTIEYKKDDTYTETLGILVSDGTWEFGSGKETIIRTNGTGTKTTETILRLTSNEIWFESEDGNSEVHLVTK